MVRVELEAEDRRQILERLLRASEEDPQLQVTEVVSAPACGKGDNFMSSVSRLVVSVETVKRYSVKRSFLLKKPLENEAQKEMLRSDMAFRNEADAYQILIPGLEGFTQDRLPFPACLHASADCVILDDLKTSGFRMAERRDGLDFLHASLAVKGLGKFHGASLAMKFGDPNLFNRLRQLAQEFVFAPQAAKFFGEVLENSLNMAIIALKARCDVSRPVLCSALEKLEALSGNLFQKLFQIVCPEEPLAAICHGDFYINNMLFRYNDMEIPEEVSFIDLQACRYSSPATDLLYLFGSSLAKGLLRQAYRQLFDIYHSALVREIARVAPHDHQVSKENLEKEIKSKSLFGLIMGLVLLPAVTAKPGAIDIQDELPTPEECQKFLSPEYFERLEDLIITFSELGFL